MNLTDQSISPATNEAPWQTKQVFDQAKQDLQSHFADVKDAAKNTSSEVQAAAASTAAAAREGYHALQQDAATHYASYREDLAHQIRQQPLKSIGLAALGGVVLGLLIRN